MNPTQQDRLDDAQAAWLRHYEEAARRRRERGFHRWTEGVEKRKARRKRAARALTAVASVAVVAVIVVILATLIR